MAHDPEYNMDVEPVPDLVIPTDKAEMDAMKSTNTLAFLEEKAKLLALEKVAVLDKGERIACPNCKYALHVKQNYTEKGWKCYACGFLSDKRPTTRKHEMFTEIINKRTVEKMKFVAVDGKVEKRPIKVDVILRMNTRRSFRDTDVLTRQTILETLKTKYENVYALTKKDIRNSAMMAVLFLTGARIQEVCGMPAREMVPQEDGTLKEGNKIKGKYLVEPLRRKQITIEETIVDDVPTKIICFKNLPVLKRRISDTIDKDSYQMVHGIMHRNISMPYDIEQDFWFFIERYIKKIDNPEAILFEMTKNNAFKIVWRYFNKKYNHWFRHQRASDLSVTYNLNNIQMQHYFGWSSSKMADRYTHLSDTDLLRTMVRKNA